MKQIAAALAVSMGMAGAVQAQQACAPTPAVADRLSGAFNESIRAEGLTGNRVVLQMWANEETGTWTVITVHPEGISCVRASGGNFNAIAAEPAGTDG